VRQSSALAQSPVGAWNFPSNPVRPGGPLPMPRTFAVDALPVCPPRYSDPLLHALSVAIVQARDAGQTDVAEHLAAHRFGLLRQAQLAELRAAPLNLPIMQPERLAGGVRLDWERRQAYVGARPVFPPRAQVSRELLFVLAEAAGLPVPYHALMDRIWGVEIGFAPVGTSVWQRWDRCRYSLRKCRGFIRAAGGSDTCIRTVHGSALQAMPETS
jgi:hypothetical protein